MAVVPSSWSTLVRGRHLVHTSIFTLSIGIHVVDSFMIATILPSVVSEIGGAAFYTWAPMLYTVSATVGTACGGFLAVTRGMRRAALAGLLLLALGNAGAAAAGNMAAFLAARVVQGLGGGVLVAQAYGVVSAFYPPMFRPRLLTTISIAHGVAALLGPIAGGAFATIGWWRGIFWIQIPLLMLLAGLVGRSLPSREGTREPYPFPLARLLLLGAAVLSVAVSGRVSAVTLRLLAVGVAVLLVMVTLRLDARAQARLFPSRPLSVTHAVGTALWLTLLFNLTTGHTGVFMPLAVQVLHGISPLFAGYFQSVLAVSWTTFAVVSAGFEGSAVRRVILVGPLLITAGMIGQALLVVHGSLPLLACSVAMTGAGMGLCFAHISSWTLAMARPDETSVTASSIPTLQSLGRAFGAATAGLIANAAGLGAGMSTEAVARAMTFVYGAAVIAPIAIVLLSLRLLRFHRLSPTGPAPRS